MTQSVTIPVTLSDRSYEVVIEAGGAARIGELLPERLTPEKAFVITHPHLEELLADVTKSLGRRGIESVVVEVPDGESSKSLSSAERVLERMASERGHRNDLVVTFGGGVLSDLGGFVASVYARGIPVVHVPTTLLAQVDAAIGGKTGVNLSSGKNLVGTFHQPSFVLCDVSLMRTLPDEEFVAGLAEVIKCGLIADVDILDLINEGSELLLARDQVVLTRVVAAAVQVKAQVVSRDETEKGDRAFLNYGHTFAHAVELAQGYGGVRHGEAVSLGMMTAAYLANELGMLDSGGVDTHRRTLEAVGLPVTAQLRIEELEPGWAVDKKYDHGLRFVLLEGLGNPRSVGDVDRDVLTKALERMTS